VVVELNIILLFLSRYTDIIKKHLLYVNYILCQDFFRDRPMRLLIKS